MFWSMGWLLRQKSLTSKSKSPKKLRDKYRMVVETIQYYWWNWTVVPTTYGVAFLEYPQTNLKEDTSTPNLLPTECNPTKHCTVLNCPFKDFPQTYNYTCVSYDKLEHPRPENIDKEILQDTAFETGFEVFQSYGSNRVKTRNTL